MAFVRSITDLSQFCAPLPTPPLVQDFRCINPVGTAPAVNGWRAIAYSPSLNRIAASASAGTVITTSDNSGESWTSRVCPNRNWETMAWSPTLSLFAAVALGGGAAGQIITSPDGITWTARNSPFDASWRSVIWVPRLSKFVAVADTAVDAVPSAMQSLDGITWTSINLTGRRFLCVFDIPETRSLLAVGIPAGGTVTPFAISGDGVSWQLINGPDFAGAGPNGRWIAYSPPLNTVIVTRADQTRFAIMRNWLQWEFSEPVPVGTWSKVFWCNSLRRFLAFSSGGAEPATQKAIISADGITWSYVTTASTLASYFAALWIEQLGLAIAMQQANVLIGVSDVNFERPD